MDAAAGQSTRLVLTGKIERESKVPGDRGRMKTVTHDEWHVSVFDVTANKTLVNYKVIPVEVNSTMLSWDGRVILCGPDQAEEERLEKRNRDGSEAATRFFDLNAFRYLGNTEQNRLPQSFRNRCLEPPLPVENANNFADSPISGRTRAGRRRLADEDRASAIHFPRHGAQNYCFACRTAEEQRWKGMQSLYRPFPSRTP
jgi:hypothetical protein